MSNPNVNITNLDSRYARPTDVTAAIAAQATADAGQYVSQIGAYLRAPLATGRPFRASYFSSLTGVTFQRVYQVLNSVSSIRLVYANFAMQGTPNENSVGAFTIKSAVTWFYGSKNFNVPVTFSGSQTITLSAYQIAVSDPIDVPYGQEVGSYFPVLSYVTQAGGNAYLACANIESTGSYGGYNEGYLSGDYTSATNSYGGSTKSHESYGPVAIIGLPVNKKNNGVLLQGDSIEAGTGWEWENGGANSFAMYALTQAGIPAMNLSRGGEAVSVVAGVGTPNSPTNYYRPALATGCRYLLSNYGTNDLGSSNFTTIKSNLISFWSNYARRGMKVYHTTILPKTNSSDGWQTVASQTFISDETLRQGLNQWLRAPSTAGAGNSALVDANGALAGVFDTAMQIEVNSDNSAIIINSSTGAISNGSGGYTMIDPTSYATGTSSVTASYTITDSSKSWTTNQWLSYAICITADSVTPASIGQSRIITSNTATTLTFDTAWTIIPSNTASYRIAKIYQTDGTHPSAIGHKKIAAAINTTLFV